MERRQYLATSGVIASAALGGCTRLSGQTSLGDPTAERDDRELHLVYEREDAEVVTVSFTHSPDRPAIRRLHVGVRHSDNTTLDDGQFRFTPEAARTAAVEIYLLPPPKGWYDEFEVYRDNEETAIAVHGLGDAESGDIGFHLLVHGELDGDGDLPPLRVEHQLTLSEGGLLGETLTAHGETTIDLDQL